MALQVKRSSIPGRVPEPGDLAYGELALNFADGRLFFKNVANEVAEIGGGGAVESVNGQTGVVELDASDVGALSSDLALNVDIEVTSLPTNARLLLVDVDDGNQAKYIRGQNLASETGSPSWAERRLIATQTMTNNTTMQNWFATAGSLALLGNSTYEFEGVFVSLNGTTSHGLNIQFAAISDASISWHSFGAKVVAATQATAIRTIWTNTFATARLATTASTVAGNLVRLWGTVITGAAGGTLIPQVAQSAASGSFTVQPGTFFRARRVGANTLVNTGQWT